MKMNLPTRCAETHKLCHYTRKQAKRHLKHLRTVQSYRGNVYQCPHCRLWHIGSLPGLTYQNRESRHRRRGLGGRKGRVS